MMDLTENLVCHIPDEVADGQRQLTDDGETIDFSTPGKRLTMAEAIIEHGGSDVALLSDEEICTEAEALGAEFEGGFERGPDVMEIFEALAEPELMDPTFVIDHP